MQKLPKGIINRGTSLRARVSVGDKQFSKDFNFKNYESKEAALEDAIVWLADNRAVACELADGKTSKYKTKFTDEITQEVLKEHLNYCPITGIFTWRKSEAVFVKEGDIAGCKDNKGYIIITLYNKNYKAHRLAFLYMDGFMPELDYDIDHADRNPSNNVWDNLRLATKTENRRNMASTRGNTGIKGVHKLKGSEKYRANIRFNSKTVVRTFNTLEEATVWVQDVRKVLHGEFAHD